MNNDLFISFNNSYISVYQIIYTRNKIYQLISKLNIYNNLNFDFKNIFKLNNKEIIILNDEYSYIINIRKMKISKKFFVNSDFKFNYIYIYNWK